MPLWLMSFFRGNPDLAGNKTIMYNLYGVKTYTGGLSGNDVSIGTELNFPNDFLNFTIGYLQIGESFTPGLGFVPSGDIISLTSQYQYESLEYDYDILKTSDDTITIPTDNYNFWRHSLTLTSAKRRDLWVSAKIGLGSFYSGNRTDLLIQTGYKICVPVYMGFESDRRWVKRSSSPSILP